MVTYKLDETTYLEILESIRSKQKPNSMRFILGILLFLLVAAFFWIIQQYAFAILVGVLTISYVVYFQKIGKWSLRTRFRSNTLLSCLHEITLTRDRIEGNIAGNTFNLLVSDISYAVLNEKAAYIQHKTGINLYLPASLLSDEEKKLFPDFYVRIPR